MDLHDDIAATYCHWMDLNDANSARSTHGTYNYNRHNTTTVRTSTRSFRSLSLDGSLFVGGRIEFGIKREMRVSCHSIWGIDSAPIGMWVSKRTAGFQRWNLSSILVLEVAREVF
jgi:hypothetical protein